jgi:hypothetical protein
VKESRKLRPVEPVIPLRYVPVEEWVQRHRDAGHHPYAAPTAVSCSSTPLRDCRFRTAKCGRPRVVSSVTVAGRDCR